VQHFEPQIKEQAMQYLRDRFDSDVEMGEFHIAIPALSPMRALWTKGRGTLAQVEGRHLVLRHNGRTDIPPLFKLQRMRFEVDLGALLDNPRTISRVNLSGMEITIPPKGERPDFDKDKSAKAPKAVEEPRKDDEPKRSVVVDEVLVSDAKLVILPKEKGKVPLRFAIHDVRLESAGADSTMRYEAALTNPKPPGEIHSSGTFGPWAKGEPGDTPLKGSYIFNNADLGVFTGIAGILDSTGSFEGTLDSIIARGTARVPDFRLKRAQNPIALSTRFEVEVDGTNGNTILKPVHATLGSTPITTAGLVVKHTGDERRTIDLDAQIKDGQLKDVLRLAMKGEPMMEGVIALKTKIVIPPLSGKVKEKLMLDGEFQIPQGKFLKSTIQDKIDELSRKAQGQPKNEEIDEVFSQMSGKFQMEDQAISFDSLSFLVPGAAVMLAGNYDMDEDQLDFHGALRMDAKISQTMSGWKRIVLKPLDPFFSKDGSGTLLHIKIEGSSKAPKFGLEKGSKGEKAEK
jgi:hypothetical protein